MSRWEKEGIVYRRVQNWTMLPHGDECIFITSNFGNMKVRLDYEDGIIHLAKRISENGDYKEIAYFPIEEMQEIVGHMRNAMTCRKEQFAGGAK